MLKRMSPGKDGKPVTHFDNTDDGREDTQPDVLAARERRRIALASLGSMLEGTHVDLIRAAQAELGLRLGSLETRMTTMVERVIDVMVSDQAHDEALSAVKDELRATKEQVASLLEWIKGNHGP